MAMHGNFGLAWGLVIAAGLCTCLGAALVFFTNWANHRILSAALGASAGVMVYVSMVEILATKAVGGFVEAGLSQVEAVRYATFAFFAGIAATWVLGKLVHALAHMGAVLRKRRERREAAAAAAAAADDDDQMLPPPAGDAVASAEAGRSGAPEAQLQLHVLPRAFRCVGGTPDKSDLECGGGADNINTGGCSSSSMSSRRVGGGGGGGGGGASGAPPAPAGLAAAAAAAAAARGVTQHSKDVQLAPLSAPHSSEKLSSGESSDGSLGMDCCDTHAPAEELQIPEEANPEVVAVLTADHHATELARMGMLTGIAVALHNLPEGMATFVAALASSSAGIAIAIAIALHNIPEGVVVAMPIYYATRSRAKAFAWAALSGAAEPLGGLLAYAVLSGAAMSPLAFAVLFGFVAGMMVFIALHELLPTALRYDPTDAYATSACFVGMAVMAASLLLFAAA